MFLILFFQISSYVLEGKSNDLCEGPEVGKDLNMLDSNSSVLLRSAKIEIGSREGCKGSWEDFESHCRGTVKVPEGFSMT